MSHQPKKRPRLYLVRHGETDWSLSGRHTGRTDIPLTARGEGEARALAPWLGPIDFRSVLRSPMRRALRTCDLAGLGSLGEIEPDLSEWAYGDYEGLHSGEIRKTRPNWNVFRDGCPGGETPGDVSVRADRLIARLRELDGAIALFTHGQFAEVFAARWLGLPAAAGEHFSLATASLSILGYSPVHDDVSVVVLWNATPASFAGGRLNE